MTEEGETTAGPPKSSIWVVSTASSSSLSTLSSSPSSESEFSFRKS
jgi:hypothetical protein